MRREGDAGSIATGVRLPDHDDRVRRLIEREAVGRAELGGVGEGWVAREELVRDAQPGEDPVESDAVTVGVHETTVPGPEPPWKTGASAGSPSPALRGFVGRLDLGVLDLLEDLAHPRPEQGALFRLRLAIPTADPFSLARIEVVGHTAIVANPGGLVNLGRPTAGWRSTTTKCRRRPAGSGSVRRVTERHHAPTPVPLAVVAGLFLASLALRPQLLSIGPLLPLIRADLGLSASLAGLLTTIPVLCMGLFAPIGPRVAARLGPRTAFALCLAVVAGFGVARAIVPVYPLVLLVTLGIGLAIGIAGPIPSMIVSQRIAARPALGTGAYAGGIVGGSTLGAALAVPLAVNGDWRLSLLIISVASMAGVAAWLVLVRGEGPGPALRPRAMQLPWRSSTGWLLILVFGLQSVLFYGVVAWLPNAFVERGWSTADAGSLIAIFNGAGLVTTLGIPLVADRLGARRPQLVFASAVAVAALVGIVVAPQFAHGWVVPLGLSLGMVFPLVLTLPLDVTDDPGQVGSVSALMLLGGYILSSLGPFILGAVRDATGNFDASLWLLVAVGVVLVGCCLMLSPGRLRHGIRRPIPAG
jgi:MFS transporter, CP family, cyanate transporter